MPSRSLSGHVSLRPGRALWILDAKTGKLLQGIPKGFAASSPELHPATFITLNSNRTAASKSLHSTRVPELAPTIADFAQQASGGHISCIRQTTEDEGVRMLIEQSALLFFIGFDLKRQIG